MSYQEKRSIVSIISTVMIFIFYCIYVYKRYQIADFSTTSMFKFWASAILILIPVLMVFKIIIHIVFNMINKIATNEDEPRITDELDKLIDLKATRNSYYVFMLGFLISMGAVVLDRSPSVMFVLLSFSMITSCTVGDISRAFYYRRGI